MNISDDEICRYIHPALPFSRCFLKPKTLELQAMSASRLQHMTGVKDMARNELFRILYSKDKYGLNFCQFIILLLSRGWVVNSVELLRF